MNSAAESTDIEKLVANALETRFENFDEATLRNAKNRILDVIGCIIGGANDQGNPELIKLMKENGGKEEATILVHGGKIPICHAALVNCVMCRSFDFEPVGPVVEGINTPGHVSGTTVMTAVSLSEMQKVSGKELITSLLVGDDVAARVLVTSGFSLELGWDGTGTVNALGATAIAGRLLGLNPLQLRHAFGIVLNQLGSSFQCIWEANTVFKLHMGTSARNGIFSAQLAKEGWTGPKDALNGRFGYYQLFTEGFCNPELLTKDLGKAYYSDYTIKPYSACRGTHAGIDCALALLKKHDIKAKDIKEVILYISPGPVGLQGFCAKPYEVGEFAHGNAAFSYVFTLATALLKGGVKPQHFTPQAVRDPEIVAFIDKIKLDALQAEEFLGGKLKVTMKDGTEFTESCEVPSGDMLLNPISQDAIEAKYLNNVDYSGMIARDKAEKALEMLDNLEELDDVTRLIPLLVA